MPSVTHEPPEYPTSNRDGYYRELESRLEALLLSLGSALARGDITQVEEFIAHAEYGTALTWVADALVEGGVLIPNPDRQEILDLARIMGMEVELPGGTRIDPGPVERPHKTDLQVAVHLDPVWRERSDFIVAAEIEPGDTGKDTEQLWARKIDESHFELCCIPFFTYHLALGDVVRTEPKGDRHYLVAEVTQSSGRFVFRVWFGGSAEPRADILNKLRSMGGLLEWSSSDLLAVDASDADQARLIADYLRVCAAEGKLIYEPGKTT